jgi:hypothetical protein
MLKVIAAYVICYYLQVSFLLWCYSGFSNKHDSPRSEQKHWLAAPSSSFSVKCLLIGELKPGITIYLPEWHYGSDTVHCADNYNPINIQKNPDDDLYHQISHFTCTQKFQGPGKTCRMTKVKSQFLYKIAARRNIQLTPLAIWHFKICLERGSWNWTKPKHSWGGLSHPKRPLAYIKF